MFEYYKTNDSVIRTWLLAIIVALLSYAIHGLFNNFLDTDKASIAIWGVVAIIVGLDFFKDEIIFEVFKLMERKSKKVDFSKVNIECLDDYIQMFYEEQVEQKIKGAQSILYLCLSNEHMEIMLEHETLVGTISRTLRDDYRKSMELTLYLLNIF